MVKFTSFFMAAVLATAPLLSLARLPGMRNVRRDYFDMEVSLTTRGLEFTVRDMDAFENYLERRREPPPNSGANHTPPPPPPPPPPPSPPPRAPGRPSLGTPVATIQLPPNPPTEPHTEPPRRTRRVYHFGGN